MRNRACPSTFESISKLLELSTLLYFALLNSNLSVGSRWFRTPSLMKKREAVLPARAVGAGIARGLSLILEAPLGP